MAPPSDPKQSALLLFFGHKTELYAQPSGVPRTSPACYNIWGFIDHGALIFGIEKWNEGVLVDREWVSEQKYPAIHNQMWRPFDLEPNRDYNIGNGLRSVGGAHLDGANELCERDGTLKMSFIREHCPTNNSDLCANCEEEKQADGKSLLRCAKCHRARYCSKECQRKDWKAHKAACAKVDA